MSEPLKMAEYFDRWANDIAAETKCFSSDAENIKEAAAEIRRLAAENEALRELREIWAKEINRRAGVEQLLWDIAAERCDIPTREMCREMAIKLGTNPELMERGIARAAIEESHE